MIVAQITDTHILQEGRIAFGAIDTEAALDRCIDALHALSPAPDLVLHTGDLVERRTPEEYARFKRAIGRLRLPLYAIPGNHDAREPMRAAFAGAPWMPRGDGDFIQFAIEAGPVRILALDCIIPGKGGGELCAARLDWLAARLDEAPQRPTIVALHHPPFATGIHQIDRDGFGNADRFAAVLAGHRQVQRVICGHVHRSMQVAFGGTIAAAAWSTAYQFALDFDPDAPLSWTAEPPAFALHVWDGRQLVSHAVPIGDFPATPFIKDGKMIR